MPIQSNTNIRPYFDDFDTSKNFYRVMFKPGYPVQARELTQSQSIINDQVEQFMSRLFNEGDTIVPGSFKYGGITPYVRVSALTQGAKAKDFIGYVLTGVVSGVKAEVIFAEEKTNDDDTTFYLSYISSGESKEESTFREGETLTSNTPDNYTAAVGITGASKPIDTPALGFGSIIEINEGSYYVNGFAVRTEEQIISLKKYGIDPSFKVGFIVDEDFVNSVEDPSLLDNSQGTSNFAAPGADRLKITLTLTKLELGGTIPPNFINIIDIIDGNVVGDPDKSVKWDWLYDLLATRTFEESGDYIITEFPIKPLEYWNFRLDENGNEIDVEGLFDPDTDGMYPPEPNTDATEKLTFEEADDRYVVEVSPGRAYVQGYRVGYNASTYVYGNKPRTQTLVPNSFTNINPGYNIQISNMFGIPDFQNIRDKIDSKAFNTITLYRNFIDGYTGEALNSDTGDRETARTPMNQGNEPWTTYHLILSESINPNLIDQDDNGNDTIVFTSTGEADLITTAILVWPKRNFGDNQDIYSSAVVAFDDPDLFAKRGDKIGNAFVLVSNRINPSPSGVIEPKYIQPTSLVNSNSIDLPQTNSFYSYDSVHQLGIMNSQFFTELLIAPNPATDEENWIIGKNIIGKTSGATAKVERVYNDKNIIVISNALGNFNNGEQIVQVTNSGVEYEKFESTQSGNQQFSVVSIEDNSITFNATLPEEEYTYVSGGYVSVETGLLSPKWVSVPIISLTYNSGIVSITTDGTLDNAVSAAGGSNIVTVGESITISGVILSYPVENGGEKRARLFKPGEVLGFNFNDYFENPNYDSGAGGVGGIPIGDGSGSGSGGGSNNDSGQGNANKAIYTSDVRTLNSTSRQDTRRRVNFAVERSILPPLPVIAAQDDVNNWFYEAILSLATGSSANNVTLSEKAPEDANSGDLWVVTNTYELYVYNEDGVWVGITPVTSGLTFDLESRDFNEEAYTVVDEITPFDSYGNPERVGDICFGRILNELGEKLITENGDGIYLSYPCNSIIGVDPDLDLSPINCLKVTTLGSSIQLFGAGYSDSDSDLYNNVGVFQPDFVVNNLYNTIELTDKGREKLYTFPYFALSDGKVPRVNYRVESCDDSYGNRFIRGYAIVPPSKITNTLKKTKGMWAELGLIETEPDFSADASFQNTQDGEVTSVADGSLFTANEGRNYIACDNFNGDASEELVAGDLISVSDDSGNIQNKIVHFATKPFGYGENRERCIIYTTTNFTGNITGKTVQRIRLKSFGNPTDNLLYQLPVSTVASLESNPEVTGINYSVYRQFHEEVFADQTQITISTTNQNERFISDPSKVTITLYDSADLTANDTQDRIRAGRLIALTNALDSTSVILSDEGRQVTYTLKQPIGIDARVKIIAPVRVTNGKAVKKVLVRNNILTIPFNPNSTGLSTAESQIISLGVTDAYKINSVIMTPLNENGSADFDADGNVITQDVTGNYIFDNGQRDNSYDISRLIRLSTTPIPIGPLSVNFDYFQHDTSSGRDFFSVDSYTHDTGVDYGEIPTFKPFSSIPAMNISENNPSNEIELRDCVDFRPIVNSLDSEISLITTIPTNQTKDFSDKNTDGDAFAPRIPIPGTQFQCDIQHYLPRIDSLFLDKTGRLVMKEGIPSENPVAPPKLATGIRLYDIKLPAYTFSTKDIMTNKFNYRRYTMKDISDIDRRVDRVEDLVTLSVLENSALNMSVRDAVTGLDRFKNGIIVDAFRDHSRGDTGNTQYRNSIDAQETHLRSSFYQDQVRLEEKFETDEQRLEFGGYRNTGNICTVNYSPTEFITQPFATRTVNVQPFSVFTYEGEISLDPPIDTFQDITVLPDLVIEDNSLFQAMRDMASELNDAGVGTVWGDWETGGRLANNRINNRGRAGRGNRANNNRGVGATAFPITDNTVSLTQTRTQTRTQFNVSTAGTTETSYGERVVDVQLARTMRSIPVFVIATKLKPNTRYFAFFDDVDVSEYFSIDTIETEFPDNINRYNGTPNSNPGGFGLPIISDDLGQITGVFLIPNGRPPVEGSKFKRRMRRVKYKTSGPTRSFPTGQRTFRLTTSINNNTDVTAIEGFAETDFVSSGVLLDKQETIVSTRIPRFSARTRIREQTRTIQRPQPRPEDPVAQSFKVDNNSPNGVFVTDLDVFFRTKDPVQGVEAYLVTIDAQTPSETILPHSLVTKEADSVIRVVCELDPLVSSVSMETNMIVRGLTSGATGIVKNDVIFESGTRNSVVNVNTRTYDVVLENYQNDFVAGEEIEVDFNPPLQATFTIAEDELAITRVEMVDMGEGYVQDDTLAIFGEPDLPGGRRATGVVSVANLSTQPLVPGITGQVYDVEVTDPGSGYTKIPSVTISGPGTKAEARAKVTGGRKGVKMGVATSDDATAPTKFVFEAPVYLLGNVNYAFVVKSPNSIHYTLWTSKIGENQIGTDTRVIQQPNLGSLFLSQDGGLWTEDQTQDIKFVINRANFTTNQLSNVRLNNAPMEPLSCPADPIQTGKLETRSTPNDDNSVEFNENLRVVLIHCPNHGLIPNDYVIIEGVDGSPSGVDDDFFNGFHQVVSVDIHTFTIICDIDLTLFNVTPGRNGGNNVKVICNRAYETINLYSGAMTFPTSELIVTNRATQFAGYGPNQDNTDFYNAENAYVLDVVEDIPVMDSYYYNQPKVVASTVNEVANKDDLHLGGQKSMETSVTMTTSDSKTSPVIDIDRTNMNIIRSQIDNPNSEFYNVRYLDETNTLGSTFSKWVSKLFVFENQSDGIEVKISAILYENTSIRCYYKPRTTGFEGENSVTNWVAFNPTQAKPNETRRVDDDGNVFDVGDTGYDSNLPLFPTPGLPDNVALIKPRDASNVDPRLVMPGDWQELTWNAQNLAKFDGIALKIVMTSSNPALAPLLDDIQAIASE